jgi:DNA-binding GntR family transcriptional regulator
MSTSTHLLPIARSKISEQVYNVLKEKILSKQYAPGERLNLVEMGAQLGVSRTPLNAALARLALEGLVDIVPHSGTFVTAPTSRDIEEAFDVRQVLEDFAARLAIPRITEVRLQQMRAVVSRLQDLVNANDWSEVYQTHAELDHGFHRLIVECAENKQLKKLWEQVNVHVQAARIRHRRSHRELDLSMEEHRRILEAFESRDLAGLRRWLGKHMERSKRALLADIQGLDGS